MKSFCIRSLFVLCSLGSCFANRRFTNTVYFFQPGELSVNLESYRFDFRHNVAVIPGYPSSGEQINTVNVYRMANDDEPDAKLVVLSNEVQQRWILLRALNNHVPERPCHFYTNRDYTTTSSGFAIDLTQPESLALLHELEAIYPQGSRPWELPDPISPARPSRASLGGCCEIQ